MIDTTCSPEAALLSVLDEMAAALSFDEKKHVYRAGRVVVPSVTQILKCVAKDALVPWAAKLQQEADLRAVEEWALAGRVDSLANVLKPVSQAWRKKQGDAADVGTEVHALVEAYSRRLLGEAVNEPDVSDEAHWAFSGFVKWAETEGYRPLAVECRIFHEELGYAGTADVVGYFDADPELAGKLVVADWKTAKGIYPEMDLQNVAYRMALGARGIETAGLLVRIPKDGGLIESHSVEYTPEAEAAWLGAIQLAKWLKGRK